MLADDDGELQTRVKTRQGRVRRTMVVGSGRWQASQPASQYARTDPGNPPPERVLKVCCWDGWYCITCARVTGHQTAAAGPPPPPPLVVLGCVSLGLVAIIKPTQARPLHPPASRGSPRPFPVLAVGLHEQP